jgi:hypothetical protein
MACFLVPVGEAIVTTVVQKVIQNRERKTGGENAGKNGLRWSRKLGWLNNMLWGGSILLALEHVWHGEVVPWPPFLTAMETPGEIAPMIHEMLTIGGAMVVFVTAVWVVMVVITEMKAKSALVIEAKPVSGGE